MKIKTSLFAVFFALMAANLWASPVQVKHDIRTDGPSEVIATGVLQASPEKIWSHVIRFNEYAAFMPHVVDAFLITEEGVEAIKNAGTVNANKLRAVAKPYKTAVRRKEGGRWEALAFMVLNTPFPVENRWYVIRTTQDETEADGHKFKRCWELVTGNIDAAKGCWSFAPGASPDETSSVYEDQADPGGNVPAWVTRAGATQTIPEMFEAVEKLAQSTP